jgi:precorrin-2 dehydrogenase/sirohydrochlorin ferrochelatase
MQSFPAFFPLHGRTVVIAGEGEAAEAKARLFEGSPARLSRPDAAAALAPQTYAGAVLAFVAGGDLAFVTAAARAARAAGVPVNVVDHPALCDFQTPAIVDRDQVVAAVGTAGAAPVMASLLRAELEVRIPPAAGALARLLSDRREAIRAAAPDLAARRALFRRILFGPVAQAVEHGRMEDAGRLVDEAIARPGAQAGRASFVLAPTEADRLSLRAVRALNIADVVAVAPDARAIAATHARRDAQRLSVDDHDALVDAATHGLLVVILSPRADAALLARLEAAGVATDVVAPAP